MGIPESQIESERKRAVKLLSDADIENPSREAWLLLAHVLETDLLRLMAGLVPPVTSSQMESFQRLVSRRANGIPFAYLTEQKDFFHHSFFVNPSVLIPRPETEELVEHTLRDPALSPGSRILDMGTGSGCIGLSLKCERPDLDVYLSDVSPDALAVAQKNAENLCEHPEEIHFILSDYFSSLSPNVHFRAIVSNPPYIHPEEERMMDRQVVDFEPHIALFDPNPEALYRRLIKESYPFLEPDGFLLFEMAPNWTQSSLKVAEEYFEQSRILCDLSGKERFLYAKKSAK